MPYLQGYVVHIGHGRDGEHVLEIEITAHDEAGVFYAAQTLDQIGALASGRGEIPVCRIEDWPDFPNRGVMLDVSRDKVPEMKTLYEFVDLLASWKYNQLQLYTEHTFAYGSHPVVWEDASPMTPTQIRDLDGYCRERFIQLVPNQNSFAHMERWLDHPDYAGLAELPGGSDLCPVDPRSLELLRGMYATLLPNFTSSMVNAGCDETWSLGQGRSEAAVNQRGLGRVYLEFLLKIHGLARENGKTIQFWADIVNRHPELISELPDDAIALEWGYEATHPFEDHAKRFRESGVRFYVAPGTSSWNSLLGRTENALENLRNAARNGRDYGAEGYLVTDWGDGGHWQFLPISYLPLAYGAALSWCFDANADADVRRLADVYAFRDSAGVMGGVVYDLGNAHTRTGVEFGNSTTYYQILQHFLEKPLTYGGLEKLEANNLDKTAAYIGSVISRMDMAVLGRVDGDLIKAEIQMNAALAKYACHLGAARIRAGRVPMSGLPEEVLAALNEELEALIPEYRQLWLARNRSGGLKDSVWRMPGHLRVDADVLPVFSGCCASPPPADLLRIVRHIMNNIGCPLGVHDLAAYSGLSRATIGRLFKRYLNCAPGEWVLHRRIEEAQRLLCTTRMSVARVGAMVGFEDQYYFSRLFKKACGISPLAYRKRTSSP